jgi:hypothetical protein
LTLDADVAARIESVRRRRPGLSLRELMNAALRAGLDQVDGDGTGPDG